MVLWNIAQLSFFSLVSSASHHLHKKVVIRKMFRLPSLIWQDRNWESYNRLKISSSFMFSGYFLVLHFISWSDGVHFHCKIGGYSTLVRCCCREWNFGNFQSPLMGWYWRKLYFSWQDWWPLPFILLPRLSDIFPELNKNSTNNKGKRVFNIM